MIDKNKVFTLNDIMFNSLEEEDFNIAETSEDLVNSLENHISSSEQYDYFIKNKSIDCCFSYNFDVDNFSIDGTILDILLFLACTNNFSTTDKTIFNSVIVENYLSEFVKDYELDQNELYEIFINSGYFE